MIKKFRIVTLIACLCLIPSMSFAADRKMSVSDKNELKETMEWLQGKIDGMQSAIGYSKAEFNDTQLREYKFSFTGCKITIQEDILGKYGVRGESTFDLSRITDIRLANYTAGEFIINPPVYNIVITSTDNIAYNYVENYTGKTITSNYKSRNMMVLGEFSLGERIVKALNYARKLCGAKEEKF